jgi:hypothetical protein
MWDTLDGAREQIRGPGLPIARYRLEFRGGAGKTRALFTGSAWRGAFGHALKRLVCVTRNERCSECLLFRSCVYPYVFETPPLPGDHLLKNGAAAPHPFALTLPFPAPEATGEVELGLTLFGRSNGQLAYLVYAFRQAAEEGIRPYGPLKLERVLQEEPLGSDQWKNIFVPPGQLIPCPALPPPAAPPPGLVRVVLETPLRLRQEDRYVTADQFEAGDLLRNVIRRISLLSHFHAGESPAEDFAALTAQTHRLRLLEKRLTWRDWTRYSGRQQTKLKMGGLLGSVAADFGAFPDLWRFLWLGQYTHAGKGTSMGLGRYRLEPLGKPGGAR